MEFLDNILPLVQIIISVVLIALVLLQSGSEGGLGGAFGGSDSTSPYKTKRGFEKTLFIGTIVVGILYGIVALISVLSQ